MVFRSWGRSKAEVMTQSQPGCLTLFFLLRVRAGVKILKDVRIWIRVCGSRSLRGGEEWLGPYENPMECICCQLKVKVA